MTLNKRIEMKMYFIMKKKRKVNLTKISIVKVEIMSVIGEEGSQRTRLLRNPDHT